MPECDACGDPITEDNGLNGEPLKAERGGEVFTFCRECDGYKTLRVPTADWVIAQRQRDEYGRTWGEQIVRPEGDGDISASATIRPMLDQEAVDKMREELEALTDDAVALDFPTADVKEAVRAVIREEFPEGALQG